MLLVAFKTGSASNPNLLGGLIVSFGSLAVFLHGLDAYLSEEITLARNAVFFDEKARRWGVVFMVLGLIIFVMFLLIQTDFLYTGDLDLTRLVKPRQEVIYIEN